MRAKYLETRLFVGVAALLACVFVGCSGETQSLNTADAGSGGDSGAGTGGLGGGGGAGGPSGGQAGSGGSVGGTAPGGRGSNGGSSGRGGAAGTTAGVAGAAAMSGASGTSGAASSACPPDTGVGIPVDPVCPNNPRPADGDPCDPCELPAEGCTWDLSGLDGPVWTGVCVNEYWFITTCSSSNGTGCDPRWPSFCADRSDDDCDPDVSSGCGGDCTAAYQPPICAALGVAAPCLDGFECVPDTDTYFVTDPSSLCVGPGLPACEADADCEAGFLCLESGEGKRCLPDRVDCTPVGDCNSEQIPLCPPGFAPTEAAKCDYVCVPMERCGCTLDADCVTPSSCDRISGRCAIASAPALRCKQAFDPGPCDALSPVYAFVDDHCQPVTYGGCEGNENRFDTLEECLGVCEGMPLEHDCPEGREAAQICLACGPLGGCAASGQFCAELCDTDRNCTSPGFTCNSGVCGASFCV